MAIGPTRFSLALLLPSLAFGLAGCSLSPTAASTPAAGSALQGKAFGGQQPLSGAHVYLFAANSAVLTPNASGYGNASVSLLSAASTGHSDSVGAYVPTGTDGSFSISSDYGCTPGQQVYLYVLGGDPGSGPNSAAGLLGALGICPSAGTFSSNLHLIINEVTTVAAAFALSGFATDATDISSSGTTLATTNIANAFLNAGTLASILTGQANVLTTTQTGTVPVSTINTIANILAACINSTGPGSTACSTLFSNARAQGSAGTIPTDTATAAINIAHNPATNVSTLFGIATPNSPFGGTLPTAPSDFTLAVNYSGGGLSSPIAIAIDNSGNAWVANHSTSSITEISPTGIFLSGANGYTHPTINAPTAIALDRFGRAWVASYNCSCVVELNSVGAVQSGANGYTAGNSINQPYGIALDASGFVWITNYGGSTITKITGNGAVNGYYTVGGGSDKPYGIAFDNSSNAWITEWSPNALTELSSSGTLLNTYTNTLNEPVAVAIDNGGNAWVDNYLGSSVTEITTGNVTNNYPNANFNRPESIVADGGGNIWTVGYLSNAVVNAFNPSTPYTAANFNAPDSLAIDGAGDIWVANSGNYTITELIGAAQPVITPIALGVYNAAVATRP